MKPCNYKKIYFILVYYDKLPLYSKIALVILDVILDVCNDWPKWYKLAKNLISPYLSESKITVINVVTSKILFLFI